MSTPAVSVVIPTHNRADLLEAAIVSVRNQTFADWELIVVDDGSDASTAEVIRRFADPRIRPFRHEVGRGAAAARNTALSHARGSLFAFLDDDDEWFPDKLERQIDLFRRSPPGVGLVYGSYLVVDRWTGKRLGRKVAEEKGDLAQGLLQRNLIGGMSSVVIRRECIDRVGSFDETMPAFEDYDLFIRIARCFLMDFVEGDVLTYSVHSRENQISRNPESLRGGIDAMARKYPGARALARNLSGQLLGLGIRCCLEGHGAKGRSAILGGLRLCPFDPRLYAGFALSLLGTTAFRAAGKARRWMRGP